jgi:hypothetical protein
VPSFDADEAPRRSTSSLGPMRAQFPRLDTNSVQVAIGVVLLFALVSWKYNPRVAAIFIGGALIGNFAEFYLFRLLICLGGRRKPTRTEIILGALALVGGATFVYFGLSILLLMFIGLWFLLDALVLKFA